MTAQERPVSVVGIGASAGGLAPLEALLERLRPGSRLAYIVLQHLAPSPTSTLPELLARKTSLKVVTAQHGAWLEPDTVYVVPAATEAEVSGGMLQLSPADRTTVRRPIDILFRSLAGYLVHDAIGVVLSGSGNDGAEGLRAIRAQGGVTFAQKPESADQTGMPQSALETGAVDFCLLAGEIGDALTRLGARARPGDRAGPMFDEASIARLFELLLGSSGVDFSTYKLATIERRLERRMAVQHIERLADYLVLLQENRAEIDTLYGDLLIGVTAFFRDREPFEALKTVVFPRLLENRSPHVPIRAWVPGCATGEEAYSIAISLLEYFDGRPEGYRAQIFATDVDEDALMHARVGIYDKSIGLTVSPERLQRFFSKHDRGYQVSRVVRDMVVFAKQNLGKDPPYSRLDLITCRNVLIYMQAPLQKKVLRTFHYSLNPDGFLMLGTSETVGDADYFSLIDRKLKIWIKKNVHSRPVFDFSAPPTVPASSERAETHDLRRSVSAQQLADRKVVEVYGPAGVLLDENLNVVQFRGQTGPFLSPTPGVATLNILKLIRPELLVALRTVLQKVSADSMPHTSAPVDLPTDHGVVPAVLDALLLQESSRHEKSLLVLFRFPRAPEPRDREPAAEPTVETKVQDLERELLTTKEYLQTSIADLATANEELQSANEELQSSNEELQSSNEELETSKEELQSTNEELTTVNEELQNRMRQLSVASDDLQNVLTHASSAVVLVEKDNTIRLFSSDAAKLLHLGPNDAGRSVSVLSSTLKLPLDQIVSSVIETNQPRELRFQAYDTSWYTLRVLPYVTADSTLRGATLDFTRAKVPRPLEQPIEIHELVGKVLSTLPHVLVLLDEHLRIVWINKAFFDTFGVGAEILGQPLDQVWNGRESHPKLFALLDTAVAEGTPFAGKVVEHAFGRKSNQSMKFSARQIPAEGARRAHTLVVIEEL